MKAIVILGKTLTVATLLLTGTLSIAGSHSQAITESINQMDACSLATTEEVSGALGDLMQVDSATKMPWNPQCNYQSNESPIMVLYVTPLNATEEGLASMAGMAVRQARANPSITAIDGLGTEALLNADTGNLIVLLDNDYGVQIAPAFRDDNVRVETAAAPEYAEGIQKLGAIMAERLGEM